MLILLSSSARKRYRDDILRCLAAPKGTYVQFRYSRQIVENPIWEKPAEFEGKNGLVCSVDLSVIGKPCPLLPVRCVIVKNIYRHGSTMSLVLKIGDLAFTEDVNKFTTEVDTKSGKQVPINNQLNKDAKETKGLFFFNITGDVGNVKRETTLANWENITEMLCQQPGYTEEQFFWTVLGLHKGPSETLLEKHQFLEWDVGVDLNKDYILIVYVFHPLKDKWRPATSQLRLTSNVELSTNYPLDVTIDSPYDLKRWWFRIKPSGTHFSDRGWMKLGPVSLPYKDSIGDSRDDKLDKSVDADQPGQRIDWEVDLPLKFNFSWLHFVLSTGLLGILISVPAVTSILLQQTPSLNEKIFASIISLISGLAAATIARLGIKKVI